MVSRKVVFDMSLILHRHLFIIGMPGAGKTYFSNKLAETYSFNHRDQDVEIELYAKRSIQSIWDTQGEAGFRTLERFLLLKLMLDTPSIISTGGGCPAFFDNLGLMNRFGVTVFLDRPLEWLVEKNLEMNKPVIKSGIPLDQQIISLQHSREYYYKQANVHLKSDDHEHNWIRTVTQYCQIHNIIGG